MAMRQGMQQNGHPDVINPSIEKISGFFAD
jgi:hypothetical protein